MAFTLAEAFVRLTARDAEFQAAMAAARQNVQKLQVTLDRLAVIARRALLVGGGLLAFSLKAAADAQEAADRFRGVFGELADDVDVFARGMAKAIGRSAIDIRDALASFQNFFVGLGFGSTRAKDLSKQMTTLAFDFAAFNNIADREAVDAFTGALAGADRTLRRYGVNIKEAALQQELLRQGFEGSGKAASEKEKIVGRVALITRALTKQGVVGDAVRDVGLLGNQFKALQADVRDAAIELGNAFIPRIIELMGLFRGGTGSMAEWVRANRAAIVANTEMAAGIGVTLIALPKLVKVLGALATISFTVGGAIATVSAALIAIPAVALFLAIRNVHQEMEQLRITTSETEQAFLKWHQAQRKIAAGGELEPGDATDALKTADELLAVLRQQHEVLKAQRTEIESGGINFAPPALLAALDQIEKKMAAILRIRMETAAIEDDVTARALSESDAAEAAEAEAAEAEARRRRFIAEALEGLPTVEEIDEATKDAEEIAREEETARKIAEIKRQRAEQERDFARRMEMLGKDRVGKQAAALRHELEDLIEAGRKIGKTETEITDAFLDEVRRRVEEEKEGRKSEAGDFMGLQDFTRRIQSEIVKGAGQASEMAEVEARLQAQLAEQTKIRIAAEQTAKNTAQPQQAVAVAGP